jgi:hypothetical protein
MSDHQPFSRIIRLGGGLPLRTIRLSVIRQPSGDSIIRPIAILTSTASRGVDGVLRKIHPTSDVLSFRLAQNVTLSTKRRPRGGDEVQSID